MCRRTDGLTDAELIELCRDGDRGAFNALVGRYQSHVYGLCRHFGADFAAAQDLAQETFVRVYLDLHALRDVGNFPAWLGHVTTRVCRRSARRHARYRHDDLDGTPESALVDESVRSPAEASVESETRALVAAAVARLSEPQRLAITMHYMDGLSYAEIAAFLDVPTTTVKNRLYRARGHLKRGLLAMVEDTPENGGLPAEFADSVFHEAAVDRIVWHQGEDEDGAQGMPLLALAQAGRPDLLLPIWVGVAEAAAIWSAMYGEPPPRPMTHDLLANVPDAANATVRKVIVSDLHDGVYKGLLLIDFDGAVKEIDCRVSDAIAIAVRIHSPILVADRLTARADAWVSADRFEEARDFMVAAARERVTSAPAKTP
jgi:RNA polymerase sigma-70 factor, ECF subfamily